MPKRKRDKSDRDYDYLSKKLKKLQKRIKRRRRNNDDSSSSDSDKSLSQKHQEGKTVTSVESNDSTYTQDLPGCSYWTDSQYSDVPELNVNSNELQSSVDNAPTPVTTVAAATTEVAATVPTITGLAQLSDIPSSTANAAAADDLNQLTSELDPDVIEILGKDPTSVQEYGKDIQKDLAVRLNHIVTTGLTKETRKEIKEKHVIPGNCTLIKAPILNPEIKAALIESQAKRDKGIENRQEMTACALSSLSAAITMLLSLNENKNPELLKLLMDTARILGDIQHADSMLRRLFILSTVKKDLKDQLEKTKIDEMLFGTNLSETLKSAKTISKSGADIRAASTIKSTIQKSGKAPNKTLNSRAPPAPRKPLPGGVKNTRMAYPALTQKQMTAPRTQHNTFNPSYRQQQPRYKR